MKRLPFFLILLVIFIAPNLTHGDEGKCIEGDCVNGLGTMTYSDGSIYVGEQKNGLFNGQGALSITDNWEYEGEWKDGERHGRGSMTELGGGKYVGDWQEGKRHGRGYEKRSDGIAMEGFWVNGIFIGLDKPEELKNK